MSLRAQNEKKFGSWEELPNGGRRYWLDIAGRLGWRARYAKQVDAQENTVRFGRRFTMARANWSKFTRSSRWIKATKSSKVWL
jgi:hypothetical protein